MEKAARPEMASADGATATAPKRRRGAPEEMAADAADVAGWAARVWCDAASQREGSPASRSGDPALRRRFRSVGRDGLLGVLAEAETFWSDDGPANDPTCSRARARAAAKLALVARLRSPPRPSLEDLAEMGAGSHSTADWRAFVAEQMRLYRLGGP